MPKKAKPNFDGDSHLPTCPRLGFCESMLDALINAASGDHPYWPEALPDETIELIEEYAEAILKAVRTGSPAETATGAILMKFKRP
jgi:hypothetical protein